jgi:hypothetical protein
MLSGHGSQLNACKTMLFVLMHIRVAHQASESPAARARTHHPVYVLSRIAGSERGAWSDGVCVRFQEIASVESSAQTDSLGRCAGWDDDECPFIPKTVP